MDIMADSEENKPIFSTNAPLGDAPVSGETLTVLNSGTASIGLTNSDSAELFLLNAGNIVLVVY